MEQKEKLEQIFKAAKKAPKRSYAVYSSFSSQIYGLNLNWRACESALKRLADILKV